MYSPNATTARVIGGERDGNEFVLHVAVDGESRSLSLPYPDDPTDRTEPLVRLSDWCDVEVDRIADIDRVPVVVQNGEHKLHIPPGRRRRRIDLALPGGRRTSVTHVSLTSRVGRLRYRLQRSLLRLSVFEPDQWGGMSSDYRVVGGTSLAAGTAFGLFVLEHAVTETLRERLIASWVGGMMVGLFTAVVLAVIVSELSKSGETEIHS